MFDKKILADFNDLKNRIREDIIILQKNISDKIDSSLLVEKEKLSNLDLKFKELELNVEKKLIEQHQHYSEKLFEILSSFLRWNKEISLVSYLGGKEPDLKKLKLELMRPMMEENWSKTNAEQVDKINKALESKGDKVRKAWEKYKEEKLVLEREQKDTKLIDAKLEILNILMEGVE